MGIRSVAPFAAVLAMLVGSCGDEPDQVANTAPGLCASDGGAGPYFLYEHPDWEFRSGADYPADAGPLQRVEPSLDWFVEYERFTPSSEGATIEGVSLRLSGHEADLATQREELLGFQTDEAESSGRSAYTGVSPDGKPTVIGVEVDAGYTVMLLSYGLGVDELVEIAAAIEQVCQQAWVDAGANILTCDPLAAGCISPSSTTTVTSTTPTTITTTTGP